MREIDKMKFELHKSPADERYPFKIKRKEWILSWANKQGGLGIEVGCGHSRISGDILSTDLKLRGEITNELKGFTSESDMLVDARNLPFPNETFDFIIASHIIEHLENDREIVRHWLSKLKQKGILIVLTPDKRYWDHSPDHIREYNPDELRNLFLNFDVKVLELDTADWHKTELNIVVMKK